MSSSSLLHTGSMGGSISYSSTNYPVYLTMDPRVTEYCLYGAQTIGWLTFLFDASEAITLAQNPTIELLFPVELTTEASLKV